MSTNYIKLSFLKSNNVKNVITANPSRQADSRINYVRLNSLTNYSIMEEFMYNRKIFNASSAININGYKYKTLSKRSSNIAKLISTSYRTFCTGIAVCVFFVSFTTTASAGKEFAIHKYSVKYDGHNYFRVNSHSVELGSYGKKLTPVAGPNGLDPESDFKSLLKGNWEVTKLVDVADDRSTKVNVTGDINDLTGLLGLSGDDALELIKSNRCQFRPVRVKDIGKFVKALQKNPKVNALDKNQSRIVTEVLVVKECKLTEKMKASHKGAFKGVIDGLVLKVNSNIDVENSGEIKLAKGSILGYMLRKPKWEKKGKILGKKEKILSDLKLDQKGIL